MSFAWQLCPKFDPVTFIADSLDKFVKKLIESAAQKWGTEQGVVIVTEDGSETINCHSAERSPFEWNRQ